MVQRIWDYGRLVEKCQHVFGRGSSIIVLAAMLYTLFYPFFILIVCIPYSVWGTFKGLRNESDEKVSRASVATFLNTLNILRFQLCSEF